MTESEHATRGTQVIGKETRERAKYLSTNDGDIGRNDVSVPMRITKQVESEEKKGVVT